MSEHTPTPLPNSPWSDDYSPAFDCTPAQYHKAIDKLWEALGLSGPQQDDVFTMAAARIKHQPDVNADLLAALRWYGERASSLASTKDGTYAEAVIVELALDAGRRADAIAAATRGGA